MLNRLAAWEEKAGVPHDRLLADAELEAVPSAKAARPRIPTITGTTTARPTWPASSRRPTASTALNPQERDCAHLALPMRRRSRSASAP